MKGKSFRSLEREETETGRERLQEFPDTDWDQTDTTTCLKIAVLGKEEAGCIKQLAACFSVQKLFLFCLRDKPGDVIGRQVG